jgi:hopanoid biosynthesis associated RND transporter like protein HpnN
MSLPNFLVSLVWFSHRHARAVLLGSVVLGALAVGYGVRHLGLNTNTDEMFPSSLPWRARQIAWNKAFPQFQDLLVGVIDAHEPEEAELTAAELAATLARDTTHFRDVRRPDAVPYLQHNGFLFLDPKELEGLLSRIIAAQPFLGQLVADPSARGLFSALSLLATGVERGQADLASFSGPLQGFAQALSTAAAGHPQPLSWENLLAGDLVAQAGKYRFVLAQVVPDYTALEPGRAATDAMRAAIGNLTYVRSGDARVRITGSVALADDQFGTLTQGMISGTLISIALITLWLILAVRSWRLIAPILYVLFLGLALTIGFAAAAVGTLNLVSVAFAILFVGIAVDFGIQLSVRFRELLLTDRLSTRALLHTARLVGPEVQVAAAATACGFLAFVPTSFQGVAELGLIAGVGILLARLCNLMLLPAALTLLHPRAEREQVGFRWGDPLERKLLRWRRPVLISFTALGLAGVVALGFLHFDADPLHTQNQNTEAMRTLRDLSNSPLTDPYSVDILAADLPAADALAARLRELTLVDRVLTLSSFVPKDQPEKLGLIADAWDILAATLTPPDQAAAPVTPADLRLATQTAATALAGVLTKLAADSPLRAIAGALHTLTTAPDAALIAMNDALTRFLPMQLDRLRDALNVHPGTVADVPAEIKRDWQLPDGAARVQVIGTPATHGSQGLRDLVRAVRAIAPQAQGTAVVIVESARTIVDAFRWAAIYALLAIATILSLALRRVRDVALVMAPLLLSSLLTMLVVVVTRMSINFANIIALPLLLGVGVSFNVYFVMNWRAGERRFLGTGTARAIVFSALTTGTAFGSLALSAHPGTSSMGVLLLISLACTVIATMLFEPALLDALGGRSLGAAPAPSPVAPGTFHTKE